VEFNGTHRPIGEDLDEHAARELSAAAPEPSAGIAKLPELLKRLQ